MSRAPGSWWNLAIDVAPPPPAPGPPVAPAEAATTPGRRLAAAVVLLAVAVAGVACSGDDDGAASRTPTTAAPLPAGQGDDVAQLNIAATGINLVATDVGLRTAQGNGAAYCRSTAPGELAPHQSVLEAAADAEVRRRAQAALAELRAALALCTQGADAAAVAKAIDAYNAKFERLRQRIDELLGGGG